MKIRELLLPNLQSRTIFFTGKGGVGKTSVSCATAVWLAEQGYNTLLVTTDPASHLSQVLEQEVYPEITQVKGVSRLSAVRIDQKKEHIEYTERMLADAKKKYSRDVVEIMKEQLNSPCAEELAAFNRFMDLMRLDGYDATIFDTAPTGHTLRLLMLPVNWSKQLELSAVSTTQLDISTVEVKEKYKQVLDLMKNADRTTLAFVTYPEYTPIIEAHRAARELGSVGLKTSLVVANYILPEEHCMNDYFKKRKEMQDKYMQLLREKFQVPILTMPLLEGELNGLEMLRRASGMLYGDQND